MTTRPRTQQELAQIIEKTDRIDRFWFAMQLIGVWCAAAIVLGFKELQHGPQAIPVYVGEMVFFTAAALIGWFRLK